MSDTKIEPYIQKRAASVVDMLFEGGLFTENLTRPELQAVEDYIAFELQTGIDSSLRVAKLLEKHKRVSTATSPDREANNA